MQINDLMMLLKNPVKPQTKPKFSGWEEMITIAVQRNRNK